MPSISLSVGSLHLTSLGVLTTWWSRDRQTSFKETGFPLNKSPKTISMRTCGASEGLALEDLEHYFHLRWKEDPPKPKVGEGSLNSISSLEEGKALPAATVRGGHWR